jgi:folate-binding protein YgfZ
MSQIYRPHFVSFFEMNGPDAQDFLHRLSTIDVKNLSEGQVASGFFLNPQGKIRSYFWLGCLAKGSYFIELEDEADGRWKKEFLAVIDQFTFSEKYSLKELNDLKTIWVLEDPSLKRAMNEQKFLRSEDAFWINHGNHQFGSPWLSIWGSSTAIDLALAKDFAGATTLGESGLDLYRIQSIKPKLGVELTLGANPLELGMKESIADQKGCYPGQEVIEKIIALGAPARRLALIEGQSTHHSFQLPEKITLEDPSTEVGLLTSVHTRSEGDWVGLAILKKIHAKENQLVQVGSTSGEIKRLSTYA